MFRLLRFGVKGGIVGSVVFYTVDAGVWKDSLTTEQLYQKLHQEVKPFIAPYFKNVKLPFELPELPQLPQTGNMLSTVQITWNRAITKSFGFLCDVPNLAIDYTIQGAKITYSKVKESLEEPSAVNKSEATSN